MSMLLTDISKNLISVIIQANILNTDNLPGSDCPEAVLGPKMINNTTILDLWIAIFVHCESTAVRHSLKKRLWTRKEGSIICNAGVMNNKYV